MFPAKTIRLCPYRCKIPLTILEQSILAFISMAVYLPFRYFTTHRPLGNTRYCLSHGCPHISKKTNGTLQSIGHAMIGQRTVRIRFIIANSLMPPHKFFWVGRSQNGTHIGSIVQWKHIPDIAIKLHHTVLVGEIYPLVIIGCYLQVWVPLP